MTLIFKVSGDARIKQEIPLAVQMWKGSRTGTEEEHYLLVRCWHASLQIHHPPASVALSLVASCKCVHCFCVPVQLDQLINYNQVTNQGTGTPISKR